jgi:hypothetical protein
VAQLLDSYMMVVVVVVMMMMMWSLVDFHEIWYGGNAIQGGLNAIIFNPMASTILKWLRFKVKIFSEIILN